MMDICIHCVGFAHRSLFHFLSRKGHVHLLVRKVRFQMPKYQLFRHRRNPKQFQEAHSQLFHRMFAFY